MSVLDWTMSSQEQSNANNEETEEEEQSPVKKMRHLSNEGSWDRELFNQQLTGGPGPLRLNLTISPSFLELVQKELAQSTKVKRKHDRESSEMQGTKRSEKLMASHFQASLLRIGDWEWRSRHEEELVAKFYFTKCRIVWEIMHEGLKSKIEIKFSDICALKVTYPKGLPGTLDMTVSRGPYFFRETNSQPRRSTRWVATTDFTGGQAGTLRHVLHCDPGIIDKHIENLFCKDHRLHLLSQENTINSESPLEPWCPVPQTPKSWSHQDPYHTDYGNQFGIEQIAQPMPLNPMPTRTITGGLNHNGASSLVALLQSSFGETFVVADEPSGVSDHLKSGMFSWDKYFQKTRVTTQPFMSNGGNISDKVNHINNQINSGNSHGWFNVSSSRMAPPEVIRWYPDDSTMTNQQVELVNQPSNADLGILFPNSVPATASTAVSTKEPSGRRPRAQLKDMFNWKSFLQTPREMHRQHPASMNTATGNSISNQINPWSFPSSSVDHSSSRMALPDDSRTNQQLQVNSWSQPSYSDGFNGSQQQSTFLQIVDPAGNPPPPSNGEMISPETAALEQICRELLGDDEDVTNAAPGPAEKEWLAITMNSLSVLIGQAAAASSAPSSQSPSSLQDKNAQAAPPAQVTNVTRSGSGDGDGGGVGVCWTRSLLDLV